MFFVFSKILTFLFFPLPFFIFFGLIYIIILKGKNKKILVLPLLMLWLFSSMPISQFLIRSLEMKFPPVSPDSAPKADVIVVLGGMINNTSYYDSRTELNGSIERLTDAIALYKRDKANKILITGGSGHLFHQANPESILAKIFLVEMGVRAKDIIVESQSRNTAENAIFTKEILKKMKAKKIILITSAFHMRRAVGVFKKNNIAHVPFPTDYSSLKYISLWDSVIPSAYFLEISTIAIKEWVGIIAYTIKGYI